MFEYRHDQKQLVERPIPKEMQGQAIVDGPLPFLFGADAQKLQARYWLSCRTKARSKPGFDIALPKFQAQAADFKEVDVILDATQMLPTHMQVHLPNNSRHVYVFDIANASINSPLARIQNLFTLPRLPGGWKRIVEQVPMQRPRNRGRWRGDAFESAIFGFVNQSPIISLRPAISWASSSADKLRCGGRFARRPACESGSFSPTIAWEASHS